MRGGGAMEVQIMFYKQHIIAKMTSFAMPEASQKLFLAALYLVGITYNPTSVTDWLKDSWFIIQSNRRGNVRAFGQITCDLQFREINQRWANTVFWTEYEYK